MRPRQIFCLTLALLAADVTTAQEPISAGSGDSARRIVAVGDVHGAYPELVEILQSAGVLDEKLHWSGGETVLVQTGDLLDRGSQPRRVLELMMRLQDEAKADGGRVAVLLGNHEVMNLLGDLRYVTPAIYARFADQESRAERRRAWQEWKRLIRKIAQTRQVRPPELGREQRRQFFAEHPPGYFAYRQAFASGSRYGDWLRGRPAVIQIGDTAFAHGGISPSLAKLGIPEINRRVHAELSGLEQEFAELVEDGWLLPWFSLSDIVATLRAHATTWSSRLDSQEAQRIQAALSEWESLGSTLMMGSEGPLWFRGYANWGKEEGAVWAYQVVETLGVQRVVVGHTVTGHAGRIWERFGGRTVLIDTGMLPGYYEDGRPSALSIRPHELVAIYPSERHVLSASRRESPSTATEPPAPQSQSSEGPLANNQNSGDRQRRAIHPKSSKPNKRTKKPKADQGPVWIGPDGKPLPFHSAEEVEKFLRTAEVVGTESTKVGINRPTKLTLKKKGVVAHAVFRKVEKFQRRMELSSGVVYFFKDSHRSEVAAYRLSRLLGMDNVPPAVPRGLFGDDGSVQIWIEDAMMERDRILKGLPRPDGLSLEILDMRVFDNLIGNIDRNQGNIIYGPAGKFWLIDHTRSFSRWTRLPTPDRIEACSRELWEGMLALGEETLKKVMGNSLYRTERAALLKRRDKVVKILREQIAKHGWNRVILKEEPASPGVRVLPAEPIEEPVAPGAPF